MTSEVQAKPIDYGPIAGLIGKWQGDKGLDVAPEPEGKEENPYFETIIFDAVGDVTNAGKQTLAIIRYHQVVSRNSDKQVFHDEIGYWIWDAAAATVIHSLTIPRAVSVLAGGTVDPGWKGKSPIALDVSARENDPNWGILQSPFMRDNARTTKFRHHVEINGDQLSYHETTVLEIYGKTFEHTDGNELKRVGA